MADFVLLVLSALVQFLSLSWLPGRGRREREELVRRLRERREARLRRRAHSSEGVRARRVGPPR